MAANGRDPRGLSPLARRASRLRLEDLAHAGAWDELVGGRAAVEAAVEARRALGVLAGLPARQREYLALLVAGFSYREIGVLAGGRSFTNVNKHLVGARARVRAQESRAS